MQARQLLPLATATAALLTLASPADGQQRVVIGGWVSPPSPGGGMHGHHGFNIPFFLGEREVVVVEREIVREVPAAPPPPPPEPPPPPRKPYAIGSTYASLPPDGCMKLIEDGASYYYCGGEWYRQLPGGPHAQYRAVRGALARRGFSTKRARAVAPPRASLGGLPPAICPLGFQAGALGGKSCPTGMTMWDVPRAVIAMPLA